MSEEEKIESFEDVEDDVEKITVSANFARNACFGGGWGSDITSEDLGVEDEEVEDVITSTGRWDEHHTRIVKDVKGRHWRVYYSKGATESQYHSPFEHVNDAIFTRVYSMVVLKKEFVTAKTKDGDKGTTLYDAGINEAEFVIDKR